MIDIHDYDIALIEKKIRWIYNRKACDYPQHDCLLSLRKDMINQRVLAHQEEIIPNIIAFNNALTDALHKMYDRAFQILNNMKSSINDNDEVMLTAHCFFSDEYPKLHPVQGDDRQELWNAICDCGWNRQYEDGVTLATLTLPQTPITFDNFIHMQCPPLNWNGGLDANLIKDFNLINAFYHLFNHTEFAITDFIYVRDFNIEFNFRIESNL